MNQLQETSMDAQLAQLIDAVILEATGRQVSVGMDKRLIQDGYLDSFSMVCLVMKIGEVFAIEVDLSDIGEANFGSIARIAEFITTRQGCC